MGTAAACEAVEWLRQPPGFKSLALRAVTRHYGWVWTRLLGRLKLKMQAAVSNPIQAPSDSRGFCFLCSFEVASGCRKIKIISSFHSRNAHPLRRTQRMGHARLELCRRVRGLPSRRTGGKSIGAPPSLLLQPSNLDILFTSRCCGDNVQSFGSLARLTRRSQPRNSRSTSFCYEKRLFWVAAPRFTSSFLTGTARIRSLHRGK